MSVPGNINPLLLGGGGEYAIERSLRFEEERSTYLQFTPTAANTNTLTISFWAKLVGPSRTGNNQKLLTSTGGFELAYHAVNGTITLSNSDTVSSNLVITPVLRDCASWYHFVISIDTTQATDSDRVSIYLNGYEQTFSSGLYPGLNDDIGWALNSISNLPNAGTSICNCYIADFQYIDGLALSASNFGAFGVNNRWNPIRYNGSYGTNGCHLTFSDFSTLAALGTDSSGNGNTWTANGFTVTPTSRDFDCLLDSPVDGDQDDTGAGGEVTANYATLDTNGSNYGAQIDVRNGMLQYSTNNFTSDQVAFVSTQAMSGGKYYFEAEYIDSAGQGGMGVVGVRYMNRNLGSVNVLFGVYSDGYCYQCENGRIYNNNSDVGTFTGWRGTGGIAGVTYDGENNEIKFYLDGVLQYTFSSVPAGTYYFAVACGKGGSANTQNMYVNFGQRAFAFAPPAGFKTLCTVNQEDTSIANGDNAMDISLYTGTGATQTISGINFNPDLVWLKSRSAGTNHRMYDTIRGVTKYIASNNTSIEGTQSGVTSFNSDGFTIGSAVASNDSGQTYVAWTWDAGTSTVSNTDGTITTSVRAKPSNGFSIVTYAGNSTAGATIGHGLNAVPEMVLIKGYDATENWAVYHGGSDSLNPEDYSLRLNDNSATALSTFWNNTAPTSSVITLGSDNAVNNTGTNYVAYCFTSVAGFSAFGEYVGNGNSDEGTFIYTGFRVKWLFIKRVDNLGSWFVYDSKRDDNPNTDTLQFNQFNAEAINEDVDFYSHGFKCKSGNSKINGNGNEYVYAALAEVPFKTARAAW